jgi:membrane protein YqaA with SNARE-associated domain
MILRSSGQTCERKEKAVTKCDLCSAVYLGVGALHWTQVTPWVKATLPALGGVGVFLSAFLDSSFVPLPLVTDLIVVDLSGRNPMRMPYYAAMAAIGSLVGCIWIYALARKGGQAYYRNKQQQPSGRIRNWVQKYPLTSVLLPAVAPFPVPFKPFVIAQGVFQVPFIPFVLGTFVGRGALFFMEGFLGVRYGTTARELLLHQKVASVAMLVALIAIVVAIRWFPIHRRNQQSPTRQQF